MNLHSDSESLLSEPANSRTEDRIDRESLQVEIHENFDVRKTRRQFSCQYAQSYAVRLRAVKSHLETAIKIKWPEVSLKKIAELCEFSQANANSAADDEADHKKRLNGDKKKARGPEDHGQRIAFRDDITVAVIGTIFKYQPEKPSILQELSEDNPFVPVLPKTKFTSPLDTIKLEDETARVQLVPTPGCGLSVGNVVNGIVCALKGRPNANGKFDVEGVIYPTPRAKPVLDLSVVDFEMVFVSGVEFGRDSNTSNLQIDLLFDYLEGLAGCPSELEDHVKRRSKVFFVGNTFLEFVTGEGKDRKTRTDVAQRLDEALDQLSQTMDVYILPGERDPTGPMLPQVPFHRCVFPRTFCRPTFTALTNPARLEIPFAEEKTGRKLDVLFSSGQNVLDIMRNSCINSAVEAAQHLLRWGHICPTAPDTLPLHPGVKDDVFVLSSMPDIFAIGNQDSFDTLEWKNTKILSIPKYSETGTVVLVNNELNFVPLSFKLL